MREPGPIAAEASVSWSGRRVLVTGGCGFIGSHLVEALLDRGAEVIVLDAYSRNNSLGHLESLEKDILVKLGDISDPFFVAAASAGVDTVFHLAALVGIPYSYTAPDHYVRTNVSGTLCVLEAARRAGVRMVVHTSTSETYGTAKYTPMDEDHPLVGQSPYAATKIGADQLALSYHRSFQTPVAVLRPFNTYGPRQSLRALLPSVMTQALFADEIRVGSLSPVRDMNYVSDTVEAFLKIGVCPESVGQVFNVGSGTGWSVREMVSQVQQVVGVEKPVVSEPERLRPPDSEVYELVCDFSRAADTFDYAPQVDLLRGLQLLRDSVHANPPPSHVGSYHV
jgi:NAD dependent epimerase/dehydratase